MDTRFVAVQSYPTALILDAYYKPNGEFSHRKLVSEICKTAAEFELLVIDYVRELSNAYPDAHIVVFMENNLGLECEHIEYALKTLNNKNVVMFHEQKGNRPGIMYTSKLREEYAKMDPMEESFDTNDEGVQRLHNMLVYWSKRYFSL